MTSTTPDLAVFFQGYGDHREMTDRLATWCRCVDTRDMGPMTDVFDEDVVWDFGGGTVDRGLAAVVERITAHVVVATYCGNRQIHLANVRIDIDGDTARSSAYFFSTSAGIREYEGQALLEWGTYDDTWRRGSAGWRIAHRNYEMRIQSGPLEIVYGSAPAEMWQEGDHRRLDH